MEDKIIEIQKNITISEFFSQVNKNRAKFLVSADPKTIEEKIVSFANTLKNRGLEVAIEVKISGYQRPRRLQLIAKSPHDLFVFKLCSEESKIEEIVLDMDDVRSKLSHEIDQSHMIKPVILFDNHVETERIRKMLSEHEILLSSTGDPNGVLN